MSPDDLGRDGDELKEGAKKVGIARAARFFSDHEQAIRDYAGQAGLSFEPGDSWTMDLEKGRGTFDPAFFYDRGFTETESMWAVCHEIEHFLDWLRDPKAYGDLFSRPKKSGGSSFSTTTYTTFS